MIIIGVEAIAFITSFLRPFLSLGFIVLFIGFSYTNVMPGFPVLSSAAAGNIASFAGAGAAIRILLNIVQMKSVVLIMRNSITLLSVLFCIACVLSAMNCGRADSIFVIKTFLLVFIMFFVISGTVTSRERVFLFCNILQYSGLLFAVYAFLVFFTLPFEYSQNAATPIYFPAIAIFLLGTFHKKRINEKAYNIICFLIVFLASSLVAVRRPFIGIIIVVVLHLLRASTSKIQDIKPQKIISYLFLILILCGGMMFIISEFMPEFNRSKLADFEKQDYRTGTGRIFIWSAGWQMFLSNPVFGIGPGNFKKNLPYYMKTDPKIDYINKKLSIEKEMRAGEHGAHNLFIGTLAETGLIGFSIFIFIIIFTISNFEYVRKKCIAREDMQFLHAVENMEYAFIGWLFIMSLTGTLPLEKYLWFYISFASAVRYVAQKKLQIEETQHEENLGDRRSWLYRVPSGPRAY